MMDRREGARSWSPPFVTVFVMTVSIVALMWSVSPAWSHSSSDGARVEAVLEEKPKELEGVTIQVEYQEELGQQLVVENDTDKTLVVYDSEGEPALRIGPDGAKVNRHPNSEDGWERVNDENSWGWVDPRLQADEIDVSEEVRQDREPAELGEWSIPVRLGETETEVNGTYRYKPPPEEAYVARLSSEPENSKVNAQLTQNPGEAPPTLLVQNWGEDPLTIVGRSGEPAIRIGPEEVQINTNSSVGRQADGGRLSDERTDDTLSGGPEAEPEWVTVSGGSNFAWQDPRLQPPKTKPPSTETRNTQVAARWEIPMEVGGEGERLAGVIERKPIDGTSDNRNSDSSGSSENEHSEREHSPDDSGVYEVTLGELNGSGVSGKGRVAFESNSSAKVTVEASNLTADKVHPLHIHGLEDSEVTQCLSKGKVSHKDMETAVGPHILNLKPYPVTDTAGKLIFEEKYASNTENLHPIENRVLVLHGLAYDGGYDPEVPVACGEFRPANGVAYGSSSTLLGAADDNRMILYGLVGFVALALPAAGLTVLRRRWRA